MKSKCAALLSAIILLQAPAPAEAFPFKKVRHFAKRCVTLPYWLGLGVTVGAASGGYGGYCIWKLIGHQEKLAEQMKEAAKDAEKAKEQPKTPEQTPKDTK